MRVDEIDPCHLALELHLLPWIKTAGTVVRVGAFDEQRYREQGDDEYRPYHCCHVVPSVFRTGRPGRDIVSLLRLRLAESA